MRSCKKTIFTKVAKGHNQLKDEGGLDRDRIYIYGIGNERHGKSHQNCQISQIVLQFIHVEGAKSEEIRMDVFLAQLKAEKFKFGLKQKI